MAALLSHAPRFWCRRTAQRLLCRMNDCSRRAPCKGGAFQWVQGPPGDSLQPEAIGAVMEVTKWLEPSISVSRIGDARECAGRNASERRACLEKVDVQADPATPSGEG